METDISSETYGDQGSYSSATLDSTPITYPARPTRAGPVGGRVWKMLGEAEKKVEDLKYLYSPKYNGWRVQLHVPTGHCYNRKNQRLSIEDEFDPAIKFIQERVKTLAGTLDGFDWLDCEGLERRHGIGRGCLIILDCISMHDSVFEDRACALSVAFHTHDVFSKPQPNNVYVPCHFPREQAAVIDEDLFRLNKEWDTEFYEGMVGVQADSKYPLNLVNSEKSTAHWVKHRWESIK